MNESTFTSVFEDRKQEAYRIALAMYNQNPDWVTFFREILGIGGVVRRLFSEDGALLEFEKSNEHSEIQLMLARLRQKSDNRSETPEPTRVITVRLPQSLHEALQAEAHLYQTSMNKLCISKLLQVIDGELTGPAQVTVTTADPSPVQQSIPQNPSHQQP